MAWFAARGFDAATVEDLAQEALLHTAVVAQRAGVREATDIERLSFGVARNLVARERRRRTKRPASNRDSDLATQSIANRRAGAFEDGPGSSARERLHELRARLEAVLGPRQRVFLSAYLDERIVSIRGLAVRLETDPANVRRLIAAVARRIAWLD